MLGEKFELLPGNSTIAAGMLSYAGPYDASYREVTESTRACRYFLS